MRHFMIGLSAVLVVGAASQSANAQRYLRDPAPSYSRSEYREYRRGDDDRRYNQDRGETRRGFCPPGQAKKPGRGSAFNC